MKRLRLTLLTLACLLAFPALADDPPNITVEGAAGKVEIRGGKVKVHGRDGAVEVDPDATSVTARNKTGKVTTKGRPATADAASSKARYSCGQGDTLALSGEVISVADGIAIAASGDCKVMLSDVTINAAVTIEASGNAKVTVADGVLNGTRTAVSIAGNARVSLSDVTVNAPLGISASGNAKVSMADGSLNGSREAIVVAGNATAALSDVVVNGKQVKKGKGRISISD
jgi:hypothetical protein